ncbi:poly [ADP-ribose] polymerase tankyrase-1-like [Mya arenaria]|uniref:poly [ADP-ribose] polymerase tankyrase-1-like n=1 Tax=Mya arenaria TaxID=6604 RepID=UPI0022E4AB8A|nr:poly [ADP-ribose] polymerase tankyrase-1-like [Mya arenaria]
MRKGRNSSIEEFYISIANGNEEGLKSYLQNGGNPNLRDSLKCPLLHKAIAEKNLEKVNLLISHGCDLTVIDEAQASAVHAAVHAGSYTLLETLLRSGAPVNYVDGHHTTPLMLAVINQDVKAVNVLLKEEFDCDANMENYFFQTALTQAVLLQNVEICEILLKHGASVKCLYNKSFRLSVAKMMSSNLELLDLFLARAPSLDLHFHLMVACIYKNYEVAEIILSKFVDPFQLKALGFITKQEEQETWDRLAKVVVKPYRLATCCNVDNKLLMMLLSFCGTEHNRTQRTNHSRRATLLIRRLVHYGLVIHPMTSLVTCNHDCSCRLSIFKALHDSDMVTSLKGQCCSVIRQNLIGTRSNCDISSVEKLPLPKQLQNFISMNDW